ncbi:hypothetical protein P3T73_03225 [Kiritimatiellota bacterium B12222]|nr:hypothetical protein P3T73_03225 [Kiritimatiellota bacterium B12222]
MPVTCPFCRKRALELPEEEGTLSCICSNRSIHYRRFPAYSRESKVMDAPRIEVEAGATCLHHSDRKAESICDECGMFMCSLCQTEHGGRPLCLNCFSTIHLKELPAEKLGTGAQSYRYDNIALGLALIPLVIMWPITCITAPVAIFMVIRHWKGHPYSVIPHSRARAIFAVLVALCEIIGWITLGLLLFTESTNG